MKPIEKITEAVSPRCEICSKSMRGPRLLTCTDCSLFHDSWQESNGQTPASELGSLLRMGLITEATIAKSIGEFKQKIEATKLKQLKFSFFHLLNRCESETGVELAYANLHLISAFTGKMNSMKLELSPRDMEIGKYLESKLRSAIAAGVPLLAKGLLLNCCLEYRQKIFSTLDAKVKNLTPDQSGQPQEDGDAKKRGA